jgi:formiminoglutamase
MDISFYFEPIDLEGYHTDRAIDRARLINRMEIFSDKDHFPKIDGLDIAIIGVTEDRAANGNKGCGESPERVRDFLFNLYSHWKHLRVADLGNITQGHHIDDTYFAIKEVLAVLLKNQVIPIIIGGSQDISYANYTAYENIGKVINFCAVDPKFDLGHDEDELSSCSYLSRIIMHQPNFLFNYTNIGYQTYYVDEDALVLMKNLYFDAYRLGKVRAEMEEIEPMIRNVDVMSFDISAIRQTDAPGNFYANPNGFSGEEACRICRYAGISDKLSSIGFYEYNSSYDVNGQTAKLLAQMIWYFIDGVAHRKDDLPENGPDQFVRFIVKSENFDEDLVFLKSKKTERWWIEMQASDQIREKYRRHQFIPCSYADYQSALNQEIPDRWWKMQQKLM